MADVDWIDRVSVLQSIEPFQLREISNDSNLDGYNKAKGELFVAIRYLKQEDAKMYCTPLYFTNKPVDRCKRKVTIKGVPPKWQTFM